MTEDTILALLARLLAPPLRQSLSVRKRQPLRAVEEVAEQAADAAWNGLIMLLRQSLASGEPLVLGEVGHFVRTDGGIAFDPAAGLLQAASLNLTPADATHWLGMQALFYLENASEIIESLGEDIDVTVSTTPAPLTAEERALGAIFKWAVTDRPLSTVARGHVKQILQSIERLRSETGDMRATPTDPPIEPEPGDERHWGGAAPAEP